jgi:uncharacterized protein YbjQ (UPF0145 family)
MKKISFAIVVASMLISGCASIPLDQQASRVIASPNAAPKGCKYKGQVVGNQGNFFTGVYTSNKNLEEGAMNDLKNQASKMGANYIQLVTNRAGNTGNFDSTFGGHMAETNVTNLGNAYSCPPASIGLQ